MYMGLYWENVHSIYLVYTAIKLPNLRYASFLEMYSYVFRLSIITHIHRPMDGLFTHCLRRCRAKPFGSLLTSGPPPTGFLILREVAVGIPNQTAVF